MATKDISRSAVEGGRANYNKYERNESHRHERSRTKAWLDNVRFDVEAAEDSDPVPRNHVGKGFTDKLGPCWGWLRSRCGQPWADVFSELAGTFDTRKLSAHHIVNQHMLTEVEGSGVPEPFFGFRSHRFFVDDDGLLRDRGKRRYGSQYNNSYKGPSEAWAIAWARGRKVINTNYKPTAWALPEKVDRWETCTARRGRCPVSRDLHRYVETTSKWAIEKYTSPGFRGLGQGDWWRTYSAQHRIFDTWRYYRKMTKAELAIWETLSYDIRAKLTATYG